MSDPIRTKKGNIIPQEVWITFWNIYDGERAYLGGLDGKPWEPDYDAPITKYADNMRYVPAPKDKPKVVHYSNRQVPMSRKAVLKNMAVSASMVAAAQRAYKPDPEYGLTDTDMAKAIKAALRQAAREAKT